MTGVSFFFGDLEMLMIGTVAGLAVLFIIVIILMIVTLGRLKKLNRRYKAFMRGKDAESLEELILSRFDDIDALKRAERENRENIKMLSDNLLLSYQKIGIIKYDAFNEMGGKLSFALALLDKNNNGFVMNSMHSREGCYTYIKEIIDGKSYITLGGEEKQAVEKAVNFNGLE